MTQELVVERDIDRASAVRPLVPSPREVDSGFTPEQPASQDTETFTPRDPVLDGRRRLSWGGLRGYLHQLRPSVITDNGPRLPLLLLLYFFFVFQFESALFHLVAPDIRDDLGVNVSLLVTIGTVVNYVSFGAGPLMGYLSDRLRRTRMLAVGAVVSHLGMGLTGASGSVGMMIGARVITGSGDAIKGPAGFPLISDIYPPKTRGRVYSVIFSGIQLGAVLGPILAGGLAAWLGWRAALKVVGFTAAFISLSFFLLKEPVRGAMDRRAIGAPEDLIEKEERAMTWAEGWRAAWQVKTLRRVCYALPFGALAAYQLPLYLTLIFNDRFGLDLATRGLISGLTAIPTIVAVLVGGTVADRILGDKPGRIMVMQGVSYGMIAASLAVVALTPNVLLAVVVGIIPGMFSSILAPANATLTSLVVPARVRGLGQQLPAVFTFGGLLLAPALGAIADSSGITTVVLILVGLQMIAAVIIGTGGGSVEADIRAAAAASVAMQAAHKAASEGADKILVCRDVDVEHDGAQIIFGLDLDVREGEIVALLGTNGAGKSTLLRAISGIHPANNGAIFLDGDDITHLPPEQVAARGVVMMPGGQAIFPRMTVARNLRVAAWMNRKDSAHIKQKTEEVLTRFPRLRERLNAQAGNLSGGEQQMLAIGQALLMKPRLLMIDELSLGLAPHIVHELLDTLREINRAGTTVLIVEQSINVALQVAQRAVYMEKGEIRFDGSVGELMARPDVVHSVFLSGAVSASGLGHGVERRLLQLPGQERDTVLRAKDIELRYGGVQVLDGVSLEVDQGEVVGLVGANGAGKTSLFDVITGFAQPSAGTVVVGTRDVTKLSPDARARLGVARSYQNVRLFPALTVRETIAVALERHLKSRNAVLAAVWSPMTRRSEKRVARRVENLVESLGLGPYADKFLDELSTGTRRIVDIACLVAAQPKLLLLDEPSSGLAQAETEVLGPVIGRIVKETGCGILIIEHDLGLVASVSQRLVALRLGAVIAEGTPTDVLADEEVVTSLLGGATDAVLSRSVKLAPHTR
jgi:ABC-type branched-subunit amino acid transport system ATPase component/MFS family permease